MTRLFGHKAQRRHARLGIDFENENAIHARCIIPAKIGARGALAAKQLMRTQGRVQHILGNIRRDFRRANMFSQPVYIFRIKIVKAALGLQLGHAQRCVAQHCHG